MSDWFSTAIEMQREIIRAQQAQLHAAQKLLDQGRVIADMQAAGQQAAEANVKAWKAWARLWGWK
ncbi:hypothetical protein NYR55_13125 [Sphingomonas sp. BGYR3]|uniref:hypothetical protein n=1 Tax=Sphingomonas sp. BGYR3 TaxID=2975483 RepID=UPI0021A85D6C|nr:hypothetical protein [Sphingomonas sp. BGYR3]MDG5489560.1 hypothetical protein [Sphingomonas sp. BGYR3]